MSLSPNSSLVRRTIDLNYANKRRSESLKWLLVNGVLLAVLAYDLWGWCGCGGRWGACGAAWAEAGAACLAAAACLHRAAALCLAAGHARRAPALCLSPRQQALLGLNDQDLDCSFVVKRDEGGCATPPPAPAEEPGSLSPPRCWRRARDSPPSPHSLHSSSPHSPHSPHSAGTPSSGRASPDEFISDGRALAAYLSCSRQQEAGAAGGALALGGVLPPSPRAHQLALVPDRNASEGGEQEGGAAPAEGAGGAAHVWRRLRLDPQRLTEYNLNLRLWLHVTVVGRVARELQAAEAAGASLASVGAGGAGGGAARHDALLPFLRPFADRQYVADRIKELARGGCLSAYRWAGGGRGWAGGAGGARPADADLLLHLFATYMDLVVPGGGFAARHVSRAHPHPPPTAHAPPRDPHALRVHRTQRTPPHYVLIRGDETLEVEAGRNNLLHTLLLFIACAARREPPALCRLHLGPAGLNLLWVLGR